MTTSTLNIGININLEKLLDSRMLIQAGSGGGKSYALRKTIETVGNKVQQIIIDPEGEFVTLREKFDFALISKDGDIPLSIKYAETLAHKLLETGVSAIIDLYELKHYDRIIFVKRFLDALVNAPKEYWHSCLLYIDEAHIFCPESSKSESMSSVIDVCTRGRKRGICTILATQRLSKLHKDAAAECRNKMIGLTGLDIDRKRAGDELGMSSKADILNLRQLAAGEFYAFGPAISNQVVKFYVTKVITTHLQSGKRITTIPPTPNAIKKILSRLDNIPQEAEKELQSKQQLQAEVTRLRTELTKATKNGSSSAGDIKKIADLQEELKKTETDKLYWTKLAVDRGIALNSIYKGVEATKLNAGNLNEPAPAAMPPTFTKKEIQHARPAAAAKKSAATTVNLPEGERKILVVCAQYDGAERDTITVLTGYKRSSRDVYIQRLKQKEFVYQDGSKVFATVAGMGALGPDYEPLPTGDALQEYWLQRLPTGEAQILNILLKQYPQSVKRDFISEITGYKRSSRDVYLQRMASKKLVIFPAGGMVKAADNLFN